MSVRLSIIDASAPNHSNAGDNDWLTQSGATQLAKRIEAFWKSKGATVKCRVEPATAKGKGPSKGRVIGYAVLSDMVNGLPRGRRT